MKKYEHKSDNLTVIALAKSLWEAIQYLVERGFKANEDNTKQV